MSTDTGPQPPTTTAPQPVDAPPTTPVRLWVERTGTRTYTGRSSRGAEVKIGPVEAGAVFTPGELLKIALAGCTGMSADAPLARRLGDDVPVTVHVSGASDPEEERYKEISEQLVVDVSGLDTEARNRLLTVVVRAIEANCTVARTLARGADVHLDIAGKGI